VSVWPEYKRHEDPCLPWYVVVKNSSKEPVYDVRATVVTVEDLPGAQPSSWASPMRRPSGPRM
jgi:hypothetical protein